MQRFGESNETIYAELLGDLPLVALNISRLKAVMPHLNLLAILPQVPFILVSVDLPHV